MNVALLYPEVYEVARFKEQRKEFPPFGVLYLAAIIEDAGHFVAIKKVNQDNRSFDLTQYDAIGFSLSASATYSSMLYVRRHSTIRDDSLVMVGGVHFNFYPEATLRDFKADIGIIGEAEGRIISVLERAQTKQFDGIAGAIWWNGNSVQHERCTSILMDIDHLPLPARHLLSIEDIIMEDRLAGTSTKMAHVMFSRGCPFPCTFCAAAQTRIQYRSGSSARKELVHLIDQYGVEGFAIADDNFIVNRKKVLNICSAVSDLGLQWSALSRVDRVDEDLLRQMKNAGCIEIKYGMESGSEKLLRAMKKNTTRTQIEQAVLNTVKAGIAPKVFVIHGFPGENMETTLETIDVLEKLRLHIARVSIFRFVPLPGSEVYEEAENYGVFGTHHQPGWDEDWSKFHIHHNNRQWWGTPEEWEETEKSYRLLISYVEDRWNAQS